MRLPGLRLLAADWAARLVVARHRAAARHALTEHAAEHDERAGNASSPRAAQLRPGAGMIAVSSACRGDQFVMMHMYFREQVMACSFVAADCRNPHSSTQLPRILMLFEPLLSRPLQLKNRLVMSPMTRNRAVDANTPNALMAEYYSHRAGAGLIITEGTSPSPNGLGYPRIPGMYNGAQVRGWKGVTQAVHARGGKIFLQLMHTGRVTHIANLPRSEER